MPTVAVSRDALFERIGKTFAREEFQALCFQYGIELDSETSEKFSEEVVDAQAAAGTYEPDATRVFKIEIPANRFDLLCLEGIARALSMFVSAGSEQQSPKDVLIQYEVVRPPDANLIRLYQHAETKAVRPYVLAAVLRDVQFTEANLESFIALQDKLHQNIGRKRTLVAIGTHDLDTVQQPFTYEAIPKKAIRFVPLDEKREFDGEALYQYYRAKPNCPLKPYLPILELAPTHPVIYDAQRRVCSLPPLINSEHSKLTLSTRNVLIECTGTDMTKVNIALNQVVTLFSEYCAKPFQIEAVKVVDESTGVETFSPQLDVTHFQVDTSYINSSIGINITPEQMVHLLRKMSMHATINHDRGLLDVHVPPTRADVLHPCDIMEDVAIAYGFNNIPKTLPKAYTQAQYDPLNMLSDSIRQHVAEAGYTEVLTWVLLSFDDNFRFMQPKDVEGDVFQMPDLSGRSAPPAAASVVRSAPPAAASVDTSTGSGVAESKISQAATVASKPLVIHPFLALPKPVTLANPKTLDFQMIRTTLLPGLMKAFANNQGQVNLPVRLFECGDVGFQIDELAEVTSVQGKYRMPGLDGRDVGARNQRRIGVLQCDMQDSFKDLHALLDRIMQVNCVRFEKKSLDTIDAPSRDKQASNSSSEHKRVLTYSLGVSQHPSYFPGRRVDILLHRSGDRSHIPIGHFGVLHPDVMSQFNVPYVCTALELNIEYFL